MLLYVIWVGTCYCRLKMTIWGSSLTRLWPRRGDFVWSERSWPSLYVKKSKQKAADEKNMLYPSWFYVFYDLGFYWCLYSLQFFFRTAFIWCYKHRVSSRWNAVMHIVVYYCCREVCFLNMFSFLLYEVYLLVFYVFNKIIVVFSLYSSWCDSFVGILRIWCVHFLLEISFLAFNSWMNCT